MDKKKLRRQISVGEGPNTRLRKPGTTRKTVKRNSVGYSWRAEHFGSWDAGTRGGAPEGAPNVSATGADVVNMGDEVAQRDFSDADSRTATQGQSIGSDVQRN